MANVWKFAFILLVCIFSYHLVRDIMQIFDIHNILADVDLVYRGHKWCSSYCDYVSIPPELFILIGSGIVLKRERVGTLGILVLLSLVFWPFMVFLP